MLLEQVGGDDEAEALFRGVLERRTAALGAEHEEVLLTINYLSAPISPRS